MTMRLVKIVAHTERESERQDELKLEAIVRIQV